MELFLGEDLDYGGWGQFVLNRGLSVARPGVQWCSGVSLLSGPWGELSREDWRGWLRTPVVWSLPSNYSFLDRMTRSHALSSACGILSPGGSSDGLSGLPELKKQGMDLVCQ